MLTINGIIRLALSSGAESCELTNEQKTELLLKILTLYLHSRMMYNKNS